MNIREVIERLTAVAGQLPTGLDSDVKLLMCDGAQVEVTGVFEIDHVAVIDQEDHGIKDAFAIMKGHPHLDGDSEVWRGIAEDADEQLRRWTEGDQGS